MLIHLKTLIPSTHLSVTYTFTCTRCEFQREIDALDDVFEFRDTHQANYGDNHIIEFELLEHNKQSTA